MAALAVFFIAGGARAQTGVSTYSALGLGEFNFSGLTHNQAMGGLGISYGSGWAINNVNPALSTKNTVFNFQSALNYRNVQAATTEQTEELDGGGLSYLAISLPIKSGKTTVGLGLNPITGSNFSLQSERPVVNSDLLSRSETTGEGGISEAYLSLGQELFKNFSLGVQGSFLFGSVTTLNRISLLDAEGNQTGTRSELFNRFSAAHFSYKLGAHYFFRMGERNFIHLGAIYQAFGDVSGNQFAQIADFGEARDPNSGGNILIDNENTSFFLPPRIGFGVTYEKINKFVIGLEGQYQDFSQATGFDGVNAGLGETVKLGFGGQYVPDYFAFGNLFKRITYRAGLEFQQTPFVVNQTQINDIGINFGGSIPLNSLSLANVAVKLGMRGTTDGGLIRENYVNVSLGFSLNDNTWFFKREFD
ncbi:MAG: hypothetical protein ACXIT9_07430 [Nitritalea sp.]